MQCEMTTSSAEYSIGYRPRQQQLLTERAEGLRDESFHFFCCSSYFSFSASAIRACNPHTHVDNHTHTLDRQCIQAQIKLDKQKLNCAFVCECIRIYACRFVSSSLPRSNTHSSTLSLSACLAKYNFFIYSSLNRADPVEVG